MNIKKIIATILVAVTCISCLSVTSFAATTKQLYGYQIINSTAKRNFNGDMGNLNTLIDDAGCTGWHSMTEYVWGGNDFIFDNPGTMGMYLDDENIIYEHFAFVKAAHTTDGTNLKCYFKSAKENKWHLFKNYVKIFDEGDYSVRYTWTNLKTGKKESNIVNLHTRNWAMMDDLNGYELTGTKEVVIRFDSTELNPKSKCYYTTDGSKPTTKSKEWKLAFTEDELYGDDNYFVLKKSCTLRLLVTSPNLTDTYYTFPIGVGGEYAVRLNLLKDNANCFAHSQVFNRPRPIEVNNGDHGYYKFYYTTDGSKPTTKSEELTNGTIIDKTCTVRVLATYKGKVDRYARFDYIHDPNSAFCWIDCGLGE